MSFPREPAQQGWEQMRERGLKTPLDNSDFDITRFTVPRETHERLLRAFADAAARGSLQDLKALMAEDVELIGDGGGKVQTFSKILRGSQRLAQLYFALWRRLGPAVRMELVEINGEPGLLRFVDGALESAQTFEIEDERIVRIRAQRNPDKLAHIARLYFSSPKE